MNETSCYADRAAGPDGTPEPSVPGSAIPDWEPIRWKWSPENAPAVPARRLRRVPRGDTAPRRPWATPATVAAALTAIVTLAAVTVYWPAVSTALVDPDPVIGVVTDVNQPRTSAHVTRNIFTGNIFVWRDRGPGHITIALSDGATQTYSLTPEETAACRRGSSYRLHSGCGQP